MSELEKTIDMLRYMDDSELRKVQNYAKVLQFKQPGQETSFRQLSEEEYFAEVDKGLKEADAGELEDTRIMEARIATKYGLVI